MTSAAKGEVLFIATRSPWNGTAAAAGADVLMTTAVFEQPVRVVFCGDGIWQLLPGQDGDALKMKTLSRIFAAFELYDIRHMHVEESALRDRNLTAADLEGNVSTVTNAEIRAFIAASKAVFVF